MRYKITHTQGEEIACFDHFGDLVRDCFNWLVFNEIFVFDISVNNDAQTIEARADVELGEEPKLFYKAEKAKPTYDIKIDVCACLLGGALNINDYESFYAKGDSIWELAQDLHNKSNIDLDDLLEHLASNAAACTPSTWELIELDSMTAQARFLRISYINEN